jgi:stearoyl-CoA desaturase (delta-9 desaturase)
MGWLFVVRHTAYGRYARDIIRDPFYRWIERFMVWVTLARSRLYFALGFLIEVSLGGSSGEAVQFGTSVWLWGGDIRNQYEYAW